MREYRRAVNLAFSSMLILAALRWAFSSRFITFEWMRQIFFAGALYISMCILPHSFSEMPYRSRRKFYASELVPLSMFAVGMNVAFAALNKLFVVVTELCGISVAPAADIDFGSFGGIFGAVIFLACLPALFEEILFRRGIISTVMPLGEIPAIVLSGVMFGMTHANPHQFLYATLTGIMLGFIANAYGGIGITIIIHLANNLLAVLLSAAVKVFPSLSLFFYGAVVLCGIIGGVIFFRGRGKLKRRMALTFSSCFSRRDVVGGIFSSIAMWATFALFVYNFSLWFS